VRTERMLLLLRARMVQFMCVKDERRKCEKNVCLSSRHVRSKLSVTMMKGVPKEIHELDAKRRMLTVEGSQVSPVVINLAE